MPSRQPHVTASAAQSELAASLAELRSSLGFPSRFPDEVEWEAVDVAATVAVDPPTAQLADRRSIGFCTLDPDGSTDLDQALHLARDGSGFIVHYAIADVPAYVLPGAAIDAEALHRGQTVYAADGRIPLHPPVLSEDAASLLPERDRRAFVWRFALDGDARVLEVGLERAIVRSQRQWSYAEAQAALDAGDAPEPIRLLAEVGRARIERERERGGASLNVPDEEIVLNGDGYDIVRRMPLPLEEWNAQLSLMTGMAAAQIMLDGGVGILRTMPPAEADAVASFRAQTAALGLPWAASTEYGEYLRTLDRGNPAALAVLQAATSLFRGAGYLPFDGDVPSNPTQAAIGAPYAHVTAPLRRLVDRWGLVLSEALLNGRTVPDWARHSLDALPAIMSSTGQRASNLSAGSLDRVEAALLGSRTGEEFDAVVLSRRNSSARIQLADPVVTAIIDGVGAEPGHTVRVRLEQADIGSGRLVFQLVSD